MPGFTHLQIAQPVTFGHHLLAYVEMLGRDRGRFADCRRRLNECPLGAAALAGTAFPIDRDATAAALGFDRPAANSLDAVSDRDFAIEFLAAAALAGTHLSRFAEEIVIWCQRRVRLYPAQRRVHDRQLDHAAKAQPRRRRAGARQDRPAQRRACRAADGDEGPAARLSKGHAGGQGPGVRGAPTRSNCASRRRPAWCATCGPTASGCAPPPDAASAPRPTSPTGSCATLGLPFRRAHHVTGEIVKRAEARGCTLAELPLAELQAVEPAITAAVYRRARCRALGREPRPALAAPRRRGSREAAEPQARRQVSRMSHAFPLRGDRR